MEEIEALEAIYGDDITVEITSENSVNFRKKCIPRTDVYFVEAVVDISCLDNSIANITLADQKGMSDSGAELLKHCKNKIADGECELTVFELLEFVIDFLDSINVPECLICDEHCALSDHGDSSGGSSKSPNASTNPNGFIKTSCSHIFHTKCILYWASICYQQQFQSKEFCDAHAVQEGAMRSAQGDLKSVQAEEENFRLQIKRNDDMKQTLSARLVALEALPTTVTNGPHVTVIRNQPAAPGATAPDVATTASAVGKVTKNKGKNKGKGADVVSSTSKSVCVGGSSKSGTGAVVLTSDATNKEVEEEVEEETATSLTRRIKELDLDTSDIERRLEKLQEKLNKYQQRMRSAEHSKSLVVKKWTQKRLFSCPICRHQLNLNDYSLVLPPESSCVDADGHNSTGGMGVFRFGPGTSDTGITGIANSKSITSASTDSLSQLPTDLLAYVRKVQNYQEKLKRRLKCNNKV